MDDDEGVGSQTGYHSALPLEVHGSGYQAMAMISNAKAEKINAKCCKVAQYSMDVELFCHTMAQKLCASAGKKYWFCNDYDVELVDIGKYYTRLVNKLDVYTLVVTSFRTCLHFSQLIYLF